jgi:hypothetical protein
MRKIYVLMAFCLVLIAVNAFGMAEVTTGAPTASYIGGVRWEGGNPILTIGTAQPLGITQGLYAIAYSDVGTGGQVGAETVWFWHPLKKIPLYFGPMAGGQIASPFDAITYIRGSYGATVTYNFKGAGLWGAYRHSYKETFGFGLYLNIK